MQGSLFFLRGKITLIQSCLSSDLPLFKLTRGVAREIEKLMQDFLWSGMGEDKRDHLMAWELVCRPKEEEGLGFGNFESKNIALVGKGLWRFPWSPILYGTR